MKIMAFADFHCMWGPERLDEAKALCRDWKADIAVIAGDITEYSVKNPYKWMSGFPCELFFCLGNHEFFYRTVDETLDRFSENHDGIVCLDTAGPQIRGDIMFAGNVLWYDGSMCPDMPEARRKDLLEHIHGGWTDRHIKDFDPVKENIRCRKLIEPLKNFDGVKVLVTHTCPHAGLNMFLQDRDDGISKEDADAFNLYSGMGDLFSETKPDIAICGHTHRTVVTHIDGVRCYNIGNDYDWRQKGGIVFSYIETGNKKKEENGESTASLQASDGHGQAACPPASR